MADIANVTISNLVRVVQAAPTKLDSIPSIILHKDHLVYLYELIPKLLSFAVLWRVLVITFILSNLKNFPLIYHLRILNAVRFVLRSQRPQAEITPAQLFQPLITSSRAPLMETDVYGHKSNSTYFSDVDIARTHLVTTLFGKAIEGLRGNTTMNGLSGSSSKFRLALGAVSCSFKSQLLPYEKYDMWTRVLSWDDKWVYLVTHFVKSGAKITPQEYTLYPRQNSTCDSSRRGSACSVGSRKGSVDSTAGSVTGSSPIAASAMSKIVFKNGRVTIAPQIMLEAAGLLPVNPEQSQIDHRQTLARAQFKVNSGKATSADVNIVQKAEEMIVEEQDSMDNSWTWEMVERERKRGMKMATLLGQQTALEDEFTDDIALGRHHDGYGVEGVVATLAQLGHFSKYQLL